MFLIYELTFTLFLWKFYIKKMLLFENKLLLSINDNVIIFHTLLNTLLLYFFIKFHFGIIYYYLGNFKQNLAQVFYSEVNK